MIHEIPQCTPLSTEEYLKRAVAASVLPLILLDSEFRITAASDSAVRLIDQRSESSPHKSAFLGELAAPGVYIDEDAFRRLENKSDVFPLRVLLSGQCCPTVVIKRDTFILLLCLPELAPFNDFLSIEVILNRVSRLIYKMSDTFSAELDSYESRSAGLAAIEKEYEKRRAANAEKPRIISSTKRNHPLSVRNIGAEVVEFLRQLGIKCSDITVLNKTARKPVCPERLFLSLTSILVLASRLGMTDDLSASFKEEKDELFCTLSSSNTEINETAFHFAVGVSIVRATGASCEFSKSSDSSIISARIPYTDTYLFEVRRKDAAAFNTEKLSELIGMLGIILGYPPAPSAKGATEAAEINE